MAVASEYYEYLSAIRTEFSDFVVAYSSDFQSNGMKTVEQQRKLVQLNMFTASMDVLNSFDPTSQIHMFTAAEMNDWMTKVNQLLNETYYVEFTQYYA